MGKFNFIETSIKDVYLIETGISSDSRGYFMESYNKRDFEAAGLIMNFVQDNQSMSRKGVLRGMHFQRKHPQGKLVRVLKGEVFDVAVDIRKDSATFGHWCGYKLSEENRRQLYVPEGLAHGFLVLSEVAEFAYKCTDFYHPEDEDGLLWNDPSVGIEWPIEDLSEIILSEKDKVLKTLDDLR